MKLSAEVLVEIVSIIQKAIIEEKDASDLLRQLDLEENRITGELKLSQNYVRA